MSCMNCLTCSCREVQGESTELQGLSLIELPPLDIKYANLIYIELTQSQMVGIE